MSTIQSVQPAPIPISRFSKRNNKTTKLINNEKLEFNINGMHRWSEFGFEEPTFIQHLLVKTSGYDNWNEIEFEIILLDDSTKTKKEKFKDNEANAYFNEFAKGFRFRPGTKISFEKSINSVVVIGYTMKEFLSFDDPISELSIRKAELEKKTVKLQEYEQTKINTEEEYNVQITQLKKEQSELNSSIGQMQGLLESLKKENAVSTIQKSDLDDEIKDLNSAIKLHRSEQRDLVKDINQQTKRLEQIKQEIRLFPSEIAGFVQEGSRGIRNYFLMSLPFIAVIAYVTYSLFSSATDLLPLYKEKDISAWVILPVIKGV